MIGISITELEGYTYLEGVQLYLEDTWTTVDGMLVREVQVGPQEYVYEAIAIEVKLSDRSPFTKNQKVYIEKLKRGEREFRLRSKKFGEESEDFNIKIKQGSIINIKDGLKIIGDLEGGIHTSNLINE